MHFRKDVDISVMSPNDIHNSEKLRNRFWSGSAILIGDGISSHRLKRLRHI